MVDTDKTFEGSISLEEYFMDMFDSREEAMINQVCEDVSGESIETDTYIKYNEVENVFDIEITNTWTFTQDGYPYQGFNYRLTRKKEVLT